MHENVTTQTGAPGSISEEALLERESNEKVIIYKELWEEDDLLEMFALRALVYQYVDFFTGSEGEKSADAVLDIDAYDPYSTFLGAVEYTDKGKRLIGTVRIISGDTKTELSPIITALYESMPGVGSQSLQRPKQFPHLETFSVPEEFYESFDKYHAPSGYNEKSYDERPYEISRLAVLPEYWKTRDRVEMGLHIMIILNSWNANPVRDNFFIAVHPRTKRMYERLGFTFLPGMYEEKYKGINKPAVMMQLSLKAFLAQANPYIRICTAAYNEFVEKGYYTQYQKPVVQRADL
ncbi:hypothetical protein ACFL6I_06470 [candidate division KSB1 bacterium]